MTHGDSILILDYGSQFTQLIARRLRELGVYCEIHLPQAAGAALQTLKPAGVVLSGGPQSALADGAPRVEVAVLESGLPLLGVCYGMQVLMLQLGGRLEAGEGREYGSAQITRTAKGDAEDAPVCELWAGVGGEARTVWMSHGDQVAQVAPDFAITATSSDGCIAAVCDPARRWYGLQFHPEVAHTDCGMQLLDNFVTRICGLEKTWTMPNFIDEAVAEIRQQVGNDGVLLALSGGVDSAVVAALVDRAVGEQLVCVLVDNGLLREGEVARIQNLFAKQFNSELVVAHAADRFFAALAGISDPEEKRKRIGHLFIDVLSAQAKALATPKRAIRWLAQGTIYPDVVESAGVAGGKAVIKTHHNVGGLPDRLNFKLLEPLRELFKDEVRRLGELLGLHADFVWQHPFPGPGLAVRVLGEVTRERAACVRAADAIFINELRAANAYAEVAQALAVFLPVQTVGVMGDARTFEHAIALRAVTTDDFMTANWARLDADLLARVASRIINEVRGVNRVVYDISSKPPATVEWE